MKRKIRLTESDLHKVITESVRRILNEEITGLNLSKRLQRILNEIEETANLVNGQKCVPFDSTWQLPYKVYYTINFGAPEGTVQVERMEQPDSWWDNSGRERSMPPIFDNWTITDMNWKEQWLGIAGDGLKYQLKYDRKAYSKYNN